jgi:hypothetical protein
MFNNLSVSKKMVINFVCRASKAKKDGLSPLELSIIINGSRKYITLWKSRARLTPEGKRR